MGWPGRASAPPAIEAAIACARPARVPAHCGVHVILDNDLQTECEVMEQRNQQEHYQNGGERFSQPCDSARGDDA